MEAPKRGTKPVVVVQQSSNNGCMGCLVAIIVVGFCWVAFVGAYNTIAESNNPYVKMVLAFAKKEYFGNPVWIYGLIGATFLWVFYLVKGKRKRKDNSAEAPKETRPEGFALWAGYTTGTLANRNHNAGLAPSQNLWMGLPDACQNILVLGGIGSGKTTRIMQPFLNQLLKQDCGGLIFDVKGDFCKAVEVLGRDSARSVETIGVGRKGLNLLKGLSPEMAASFLKSAFFLSGPVSGDSMFWIDTATELCRNALGVLSYVPGSYSLQRLYDYIFDPMARETYTSAARQAVNTDRDNRLFAAYSRYYDNVFINFDNKVKQGVLATVSQVLSGFQHPDLIDAFCIDHEDAANMEEVLDGQIFLVDLPLATWGLGGKVVYTFIKLRFFNVLQIRPTRSDINQDRPIFFMCDEYQDIISASKTGLSDLNFWDKSRSAKCIGIISSQSISSFRAAIGDRTLADTVLQNFRQKYCFRSEDPETLEYLNKLSGKAEVQRVSESAGSTSSFSNSSSSAGTSISWQERNVIDAQLIRNMNQDQAVALLNICGSASDDVVILKPVFV